MKINLCKTFHLYSIKKPAKNLERACYITITTELFDSTTVVSIFLPLEHDSHSILNRSRVPVHNILERQCTHSIFRPISSGELMLTRKQKNVEDVISCCLLGAKALIKSCTDTP